MSIDYTRTQRLAERLLKEFGGPIKLSFLDKKGEEKEYGNITGVFKNAEQYILDGTLKVEQSVRLIVPSKDFPYNYQEKTKWYVTDKNNDRFSISGYRKVSPASINILYEFSLESV